MIAGLTRGRGGCNGCKSHHHHGSPTVFPLKVAVPAAAPVAAAPAAAAPVAKEAAPAAAAKAAAAAAGGDKDKKKDKKEKAAAPAKEKEAAAPAKEAAAAPAADLDPTRLDIRVGRIVKCWDHPESTKLLCEEVDMGDGETRSITSGLRDHYKAEELVDKHVIVICNLKERTMAGFKSQGMVMCAVAPEHKDVKLLVAPTGAVAGDRIHFPGFNAANEPPLAPNQVAKKKILENLLPFFHMNMTKGEATWKEVPFTVVRGKDADATVVGVVGTAAPVDPAHGMYAIS